MLNSYLRKDENTQNTHQMKQVLGSHLLHLVTRIYKATTLFKPFGIFLYLRTSFCASVPTHGGSLCKNTGQYTKAGIYISWKAEKYESSSQNFQNIAVTKVPGILHLSRVFFFKEISHGECWKYHFWASRFQNFLGEDVPRSPIQTRASRARLQSAPL